MGQVPGRQYRITLQKHADEHSLCLRNSKCCSRNTLRYTFDKAQLNTDIGQNLYQTQTKGKLIDSTSPQQRRERLQRTQTSNAVKSQLNNLSAMITGATTTSKANAKGKKDEIIKLDLFD